jgi:glycosyltransferase involved in cell wall biosynthesis
VPAEPAPPRPARRFVYVGHVKTTKGLREILTAAEKLPAQDCTVDVYGPFSDGFSEREFEGNTRVTYHGVLTPDQVIPTLRRYDVVLLPTYHFGEGYPGVVLVAYAAGLPVIASRWRSIPEIVEEGVSGLLVEPRDADDLARAMNRLCEDPECLRVLIQGACALAQRFRSELWTDEFIWICRQVLAEHAG